MNSNKRNPLPSVRYVRGWLNALIIISTMFGAVVLPSRVCADPLVFEDGEFLPVNWQRTTIAAAELGNDISLLVTRPSVDGNPDAFRRHYFHVEAPTNGLPVISFSRNLTATVDPASLGGISFINYSEDARLESGGSVGQSSGPALIQEGADGVVRVFIPSAPAFSLMASDPAWTRKSLSQVIQNDFAWVRGGPSATFMEETVHPDFSPSGKPVGFGFYRLVLTTNTTVSFHGGIDNWRVEIQPGSTNNQRPIAAVVDRADWAIRNSTVVLDGSASYDPDNGPDPLSYSWVQTQGRPTSLVQSGATLTFTPDRSGKYTFSLTVSDGSLASHLQSDIYVLSLQEGCHRKCCPSVPGVYYHCDVGPDGCPVKEMRGKACIAECIDQLSSATNQKPKAASTPPDDDGRFLSIYREVRDSPLASTLEGQRLIQQFESHSPEMIKLFAASFALSQGAMKSLETVASSFDALVNGQGASAILTNEHVQALNKLMDDLSAKGSQSLRDAITAERTRWGPLENYVGRSATEIQQTLLGYGVYLPRVTSSSTLVLTNAAANQARATIDWTDSTGKIIASAEKILSPQGVTVVPAPSTDFNGAARILSDRLVRAFVVNRSTNGSVLGTDEGAVPGKRVSVPLFRQPGATGAGTTLTVYNIDATSSADVTLGHRDEKGSDQGTKTVTIPPMGLYTFDAKAINGKAKGASAAVISSTRPVVVSQQSTSKGSRAMLPAVAESKECTSCSLGLVPFGPSKGAGQRADIYVHNRDTAEATVTLTYLDPQGNKRATQQQKIPALGLARFDAAKAVRRGRTLNGYVQVTQSGSGTRRLAVQWIVRNEKGSPPIGFNAVGTTSGAPTWACVDSQREKNERQRPVTKLAILNPTGTADQATVELCDAESGQRLSTQTVQLPASGLVELSLTTKAYRQASVGFAVVRSASGAGLIINAHSGAGGGASRSSCQPLV